nr:hypothetical protein [Bacillus licheniformis]
MYQIGIVLLTNKKHSPVINPKENPNQFEGDEFATGKYGGCHYSCLRGVTSPIGGDPLYEKISSMRVDCIAVIVSRFATGRSRSRSKTASGTKHQTNGQQDVA